MEIKVSSNGGNLEQDGHTKTVDAFSVVTEVVNTTLCDPFKNLGNCAIYDVEVRISSNATITEIHVFALGASHCASVKFDDLENSMILDPVELELYEDWSILLS